MKSHIRSPRRVTLAPIELPVRTRNWAIERLALVTIGFWPVMVVRSPSAASSAFAFDSASPSPMLTTIFDEPRDLVRVAVFELLLERRHDLGRVALLEAAGHALTSSCCAAVPADAHAPAGLEGLVADAGRLVAARRRRP